MEKRYAAVPELLDLIDVEGAVLTADTMSCQKKIVEKITGAKANYTIGLKQNQLHWRLDVIFHEDASRVRKDNSPLNLNVLWKTALH